MLTGHIADFEEKNKDDKIKPNYLVSKPINFKQLLTVINVALGR
jgi:hypothetical protein